MRECRRGDTRRPAGTGGGQSCDMSMLIGTARPMRPEGDGL
jgi:hypothetical protein